MTEMAYGPEMVLLQQFLKHSGHQPNLE